MINTHRPIQRQHSGYLQLFSLVGLCLLILSLSVVSAQNNLQRSINGAASVADIRPENQVRLWTFTLEGKDIGLLASRVEGTERIDDRQAFVIWDSLRLDLGQTETVRTINNWGKTYLSSVGSYLGSDLFIATDTAVEELHLRLESNPDRKQIAGYFTRGGREVRRTVPIERDMFGWDVHLIDQLELWLSMQDFKVGDTLKDTLFSPQTLLATPISGIVDKFMYRQLYQGKFDSVFVIEMDQPQPLQLSFTPDKRLARVDFTPQRIRAYLDYAGIPRQPTAATSRKSTGATKGVDLIIRVFLLTLAGMVSLWLMGHQGIKALITYLGLAVGAAACGLALLVLTPLQHWLIGDLQLNPTDPGNAVYALWLIPAAVLAIFQEGLKAGAIFGTLWWRNPRDYLFVPVGAALGAGFGIVETSYYASASASLSLLDWSLLGQSFTILFHAVAGGLIGLAILSGRRQIILWLIVTIFVNLVIRYLPVLVLTNALQQQLVYLATAAASTIFLLIGVIMVRRPRQ